MRKRLICAALALTMIFSMTACGTEKKIGGNRVILTVDELKGKMSEALANIDSVDIDADIDLGATVEASGQTVTIDMHLDGEGKSTIKTPAAYIKGNFSLKTTGFTEDNVEMNHALEGYFLTDDESATTYYNIDDKGWYTGTSTYEELTESITSLLSKYGADMGSLGSFSSEEVNPDLLPVITNRTVEAEGRECYELVVKQGKEVLAGTEQEIYDMFNKFEGSVNVYVDVETYLPIKMSYTVDVNATTDIQGYETNIKLTNCKIEMLAKYNEVAPIEVPGDIVERAANIND